MEGATGVAHREHLLPGGNDYERARKWRTSDVNAAVDAAIVGHFGTPVVLVTGADDLCREASEDLPGVHTVEVKHALGPSACASLTPRRTSKMIREAAERAVRDRARFEPVRVASPVKL